MIEKQPRVIANLRVLIWAALVNEMVGSESYLKLASSATDCDWRSTRCDLERRKWNGFFATVTSSLPWLGRDVRRLSAANRGVAVFVAPFAVVTSALVL